MSKDLYYRIRTFQALNKAWKQVYNNGVKSQSLETQNAVKEFRSDSDRQLRKIQRQLQQNKFKFSIRQWVLKFQIIYRFITFF